MNFKIRMSIFSSSRLQSCRIACGCFEDGSDRTANLYSGLAPGRPQLQFQKLFSRDPAPQPCLHGSCYAFPLSDHSSGVAAQQGIGCKWCLDRSHLRRDDRAACNRCSSLAFIRPCFHERGGLFIPQP